MVRVLYFILRDRFSLHTTLILEVPVLSNYTYKKADVFWSKQTLKTLGFEIKKNSLLFLIGNIQNYF
jgi:hypothetical protein